MNRQAIEVLIISRIDQCAVVLRYNKKKDKAPFVIAKGKYEIAMQIENIAKKNHMYITQYSPLARMLYADVEVAELIPERYFYAVAEILAYIYKIKNTLSK